MELRLNSFLLLSSFIVATLSGCAQNFDLNQTFFDGQETGIMGGDVVAAESLIARSTVAIYDHTTFRRCTGTLVNSNLVLTAAHCINPENIEKLYVVFQREYNSGIKTARQAAKVIVHEKFVYKDETKPDNGDIALIFFAGSLPEGYQPAKMLLDADKISQGSSLIIAGYGLTWAWGFNGSTGVLRSVSLKVHKPLSGQTEMELAQTDSRGACAGDSGGPVYLIDKDQIYLVAVINRVMGPSKMYQAQCRERTYTARVDKHKEWIFKSFLEMYR